MGEEVTGTLIFIFKFYFILLFFFKVFFIFDLIFKFKSYYDPPVVSGVDVFTG